MNMVLDGERERERERERVMAKERAKRNAGEEAQGKTDRHKLADAIHAATNSPHTAIDVALLRHIKTMVRASDDNVRAALDLLMDRLKKNHAQVRYLSLLLIDELFTRSKLFRSILVPVFETFLLLSVGYRSDYALPPPSDRAALLRNKSMEFVEKWNDMFGQHYRQIRLGYEYLKNTVRLQFPNLREAAARAEQQRSERDRRTQELLKKKYERLQEEFADAKKDILFTLLQMEECFSILEADQCKAGAIENLDGRSIAHQHQEDVEGEDGEEQYEEYGTASLRALHEAQGDEVLHQETQDNAAVFDSLRELLKVLTNKHIPNTQEWMSVLMRVDLQEGKFHDVMLKEVIDIRNQLFSARNTCERLGLKCAILGGNPTGEDNVDGIEWEVGGVSNASFEPCYEPTSTSPEEQVAAGVAEGSHKSGDATNSSVSMKTSTDSLLPDKARQGLLNEAPMLTWGSFLDNWGKESGVPANTRGLLLENHWGKVDPDALIPADKIAEINMRSTYYQPQSSDIRACSAPLRKGGLCQRKDLHTCPLHGRIIPRDSLGQPMPSHSLLGETSSRVDLVPSGRRSTSTESMHESITDADDQLKGADIHALEPKGQIVGAILKQAITNVRVKDETNRKLKIVLKNKRRKDREHNEAVLRAAAMAQTSQGLQEILGEDLESSDSHERRGKASHNRSGGLTSLLRKKPTVKDRLAKRLLTGRVTDATVAQLTRDEESSYRQSFHNQW